MRRCRSSRRSPTSRWARRCACARSASRRSGSRCGSRVGDDGVVLRRARGVRLGVRAVRAGDDAARRPGAHRSRRSARACSGCSARGSACCSRRCTCRSCRSTRSRSASRSSPRCSSRGCCRCRSRRSCRSRSRSSSCSRSARPGSGRTCGGCSTSSSAASVGVLAVYAWPGRPDIDAGDGRRRRVPRRARPRQLRRIGAELGTLDDGCPTTASTTFTASSRALRRIGDRGARRVRRGAQRGAAASACPPALPTSSTLLGERRRLAQRPGDPDPGDQRRRRPALRPPGPRPRARRRACSRSLLDSCADLIEPVDDGVADALALAEGIRAPRSPSRSTRSPPTGCPSPRCSQSVSLLGRHRPARRLDGPARWRSAADDEDDGRGRGRATRD